MKKLTAFAFAVVVLFAMNCGNHNSTADAGNTATATTTPTTTTATTPPQPPTTIATIPSMSIQATDSTSGTALQLGYVLSATPFAIILLNTTTGNMYVIDWAGNQTNSWYPNGQYTYYTGTGCVLANAIVVGPSPVFTSANHFFGKQVFYIFDTTYVGVPKNVNADGSAAVAPGKTYNSYKDQYGTCTNSTGTTGASGFTEINVVTKASINLPSTIVAPINFQYQ